MHTKTTTTKKILAALKHLQKQNTDDLNQGATVAGD
jgi:hypothetical protein